MMRPELEMMKSRNRCEVTRDVLITRRRIIRTIQAMMIEPMM